MFDAIVVGARVAGSSTATLLTRAGYRVLVLDRAALPSAKAPSTSLVHPAGLSRLRRWGLLDDVLATGSPTITHYGLRSGSADLTAALPAVDGVDYAVAPRRETLHDILTRAAADAGADVRDEVAVEGLLTGPDGEVRGIRARTANGSMFTEHARVVIGADGSNSKVARLTGAAKYDIHPVLSRSSWAYFAGVPRDGRVRTYRHDPRHAFTWPTYDGLTIAGVAWPASTAPVSEPEVEDDVLRTFAAVDPEMAERLRAGDRSTRWFSGAVPNFLRTASGPGWALVGDAGCTRDPITAAGITEALRSAELLAYLLDDALAGKRDLSAALADYTRRRDEMLVGHYEYTCDYARVADHSAEELALIQAMIRSPRHSTGMIGVFSVATPPAEFYAQESLHELLDHVPTGPDGSWRVGLVRWLARGTPGRTRAGRRLADRLIAANLGPMGKYLTGPSADRSPEPFLPRNLRKDRA